MNLPVLVTIGNQTSAFPTPTGASFTYDAPIINFVTPNPGSARGGDRLTIRGKNFGFIESGVTVNIGNLSCGSASWMNDGSATCLPQVRIG